MKNLLSLLAIGIATSCRLAQAEAEEETGTPKLLVATVNAHESAQTFAAGVSLAAHDCDKMRRSAVGRPLVTVGDACIRLRHWSRQWSNWSPIRNGCRSSFRDFRHAGERAHRPESKRGDSRPMTLQKRLPLAPNGVMSRRCIFERTR